MDDKKDARDTGIFALKKMHNSELQCLYNIGLYHIRHLYFSIDENGNSYFLKTN